MPDPFALELERLLSSELTHSVFQPIVDITTRSVFGYEGLSRGPSDSQLHAAPLLFETADRCGRTMELEALCLRTIARDWSTFQLDSKLFVNVSPEKLKPSGKKYGRLLELIKAHRLSPERIVIELSERYPTQETASMIAVLSWLKEQGFQIAIDDLGSGYSGLKLWSDLKPDYVKIDRHFIRDIDTDLVKKEFVLSVVELADRLNCELIAEGVETESELAAVTQLNIHLIQGFLFGRPKAIPQVTFDCLKSSQRQPVIGSTSIAQALTVFVQPIPSSTTIQDAWQRFQNEPTVFSLPIVDEGKPRGLLHRWRVLELYSTPYGRELYGKKMVYSIASADALVVEETTPMEEISRRLVDEDQHYLKQHFIVVSQGNYIGLGTTRALLQLITTEKIERARHANPLTQLPGNVPIQTELEWRLGKGEAFSLVYFDINYFKPLNDVLGYRTGDRVIKSLASILKEIFSELDDFVGHIGGDDFVVISHLAKVEHRCSLALRQFGQKVEDYFPADVIEQGYIETYDRSGVIATFPLTSLSAGIVFVEGSTTDTAETLANEASHVKLKAKASISGMAMTHR